MSRLQPLARGAKTFVKEHLSVVGSLVRVRTAAPEFALTFDDGPAPGSTDAVLEVLERRAVRATFFVLLSAVRRSPGLLADVVAAGHEVALHGVDHRALTTLPAAEVRRRQCDGRAELEDAVGATVRFMRPPYGRQSLRTWQLTRAAGMTPALWGPTTWDWRDVPQQERIDHCVAALRPGEILLAHDAFAGPADGVDDGPAPAVDRAGLIDAVLGRAADAGLRAVPLGALVDGGTPVLAAVFRR